MDKDGYKHIVVFGANGGIGFDAVKAIAQKVLESDKPIKVHLIARDKDNAQNPPLGLMHELFEAYENKPQFPKLERAFSEENHQTYSPKNIEKLEPALRDADAIILAAGAQRGPKQERDAPEVVENNTAAITPMLRAIARYAPASAPVVVVTNPLDIMVTKADEIIRQEWEKNPPKDAPDIKVIGMAGLLDEARLRIFTARELNKAMADAFPGKAEHLYPHDITGNIFAEHGPSMVIDKDSIQVRGKPIAEFLQEKGLDKKVLDKAVEATKKAGGEQIKRLGRSVQLSAAEKIVDMVDAIFQDKPQMISAAVTYDDKTGKKSVASGRPVVVGGGKIAYGDWPESAQSQIVQEEISASRDKIRAAIGKEQEMRAQRHSDLTGIIGSAKGIHYNDNGKMTLYWGNNGTPPETIVEQGNRLEKYYPKDKIRIFPRTRSIELDVGRGEIPAAIIEAARSANRSIQTSGMAIN